MPSDKITKLCEYLDKNKAKNYQVPNAMLQEETDYIKNSYFKMLAVLLQQASAIQPSQEDLFARMVEGVKTDYSMQDYLRQALEIEIEEFEEFASQYREVDLRYRFLLDAILLCSVTEAEEGQLRLAASYMEVLMLEQEEIHYLLEVAKSILAQSSELYTEVKRTCPDSISDSYFQDYIKLFHIDELLRIQPETKEAINLRDFLHIPGSLVLKQKKVYMRNLELDLSEYTLEFSGNEEIVFEDCEFHGGENPIILKEIQKVHFSKCTFQNFTNRVIVETAVKNVVFEECSFSDCSAKYIGNDGGELGIIVYVTDADSIENIINHFYKCNFENCSSDKESREEGCYALICNVISEVSVSKFKDCYHCYKNWAGSFGRRSVSLFVKGTKEELNTYK